MTREEAIKYLEQHKYFDTCEQKSLEESNEAIDMAIEALKGNHVVKVQIDLSPVEEMVKETVAEAIKNYDKLRR